MKDIYVESLGDYEGSLQQLQFIIEGLIEQYGGETIIKTDAGYNNVSFLLTPKK